MFNGQLIFKAVVFIILINLYACSGSQQKKDNTVPVSDTTTTAADGKGFLKMKLSGITDEQVTKGTAFLFMLPEGWTYSGNISWDFSSANFPARGEMQVSNADNTVLQHIYPMKAFMLGTQMLYMSGFRPGSKYMGCYVQSQLPPDTKTALLNEVTAQRLLPAGFKIADTKVTPVPASTNPADVAAVRNNPQAAFFSDNIIITGTFNKNGEEWKAFVSGNVNGMVNKTAGYASWSITPMITFIKNDPHEKENEMLVDAVYRSIRPSKQFVEVQLQVTKMLTNQFYANQRTIAAISQNISRNSDAFLANIDKQYATHSSTGSTGSSTDAFDQYIRGTENYKDPDGDVYELPANYNNAWKSGNGEVIMTNNTGYNPNEDMNVSNQTWQPLNK
ncbi:hypothetical protein [Ferruginibacter albus]|uniref:hypothetical protein n=1 Tax=Ferruginibacter albus TaxID=2875540 RepID=UPI001CC6A2F1|nr:hypothetical protein [Ferruginibacter albus]UAY51278.1 hypothetical protein K9M53_11835 [Ferruginibacter albus]